MSEAKRRGNPNWTKGTSGNTKGRPRTDQADAKRNDEALRQMHSQWLNVAYQNDGWYSLLTGLGTTSRDKRQGTRFYSDVINYEEGRELWRGDDLGARIVEALVDEALREQFKITIPDDAEGNDEEYGKELTDKVYAFWKSIGLVEALHLAWCYERALGGSAILLGVDDGAQSLIEPINEKRVKAFNWLTVLEPQEVSPIQWYTDPLAPKFGQVELYQLTPISMGAPKPGQKLTHTVQVHESRLVVFGGIRVSRIPQPGTFGGWGDSVFTRVYRILRDFNSGFAGASILMAEFGSPVFKMKGLADILKRDSKADFLARMQALVMSMSTARCALIDQDEEYTRQATPVTGLPELLELSCKRVAAAAKTPLPVLFGESPGGLNASGASGDQLQLWRNSIGAEQTKKLEPPIRRITTLGFAAMGGVPDAFEIEFPPLHKATRKEEADTLKVEVDTMCALYDRNLLSETEIRRRPEFAKQWGVVVEDEPDTLEPGAAETAEMLATKPGAPAIDPATGVAAPAGDLQKQALNGAQISSMIEVIKAVALGEISRQSGVSALVIALQITEAEAQTLVGPDGFEAKQPDPPMGGGFGGGGFPSGKSTPPAADKPAEPSRAGSAPEAKSEEKPAELPKPAKATE